MFRAGTSTEWLMEQFPFGTSPATSKWTWCVVGPIMHGSSWNQQCGLWNTYQLELVLQFAAGASRGLCQLGIVPQANLDGTMLDFWLVPFEHFCLGTGMVLSYMNCHLHAKEHRKMTFFCKSKSWVTPGTRDSKAYVTESQDFMQVYLFPSLFRCGGQKKKMWFLMHVSAYFWKHCKGACDSIFTWACWIFFALMYLSNFPAWNVSLRLLARLCTSTVAAGHTCYITAARCRLA